jgi:glyoxylase-like metal-dependent hydrolase (beta-lactamase superfamily II)
MTAGPVEFAPVAGLPLMLAADLTLVLAPNPSPMTNMGTNTFLLGRENLAVIDPGPLDQSHLSALMDAIDGRPVSHIFVTHSHLDHSPLAAALSNKTGAAIYAFGDSLAGRSQVMQGLAARGLAGGGEGIDMSFRPDHTLEDGAQIRGDWGTLTAIHTPGHLGNHLCFGWQDAIFTGDHVMGWASSLVSPPDGDLTDFMLSCEKLQNIGARIYYPAHGAPVLDPAARITWLIAHRKTREAQIMKLLGQMPATPSELTKAIYKDTPVSLLLAAERNVFAHLVDLQQRGKVSVDGPLSAQAIFASRTL